MKKLLLLLPLLLLCSCSPPNTLTVQLRVQPDDSVKIYRKDGLKWTYIETNRDLSGSKLLEIYGNRTADEPNP